LQIEGRVLTDLAHNYVIPSAIAYQSRIAENIKTLLKIGQAKSSVSAQTKIVNEISVHINEIYDLNKK